MIPPGHWCDGALSLQVAGAPAVSLVAEKMCYYRMEPAAGWALQRLYDDAALDETLVLRHGDATMVRDSRHPVVAAPDCLL